MIRVKNKDVDGIILLSAQEAKNLPVEVLKIDCWWWLRSRGRYSRYAAGVNEDGSINSYGRPVRQVTSFIRPALRIKNLDEKRLKIGEMLQVLGRNAQYVGNNLALLIEPIAAHRFAEKSHFYETSEVKRIVEEWLAEQKLGNEDREILTAIHEAAQDFEDGAILEARSALKKVVKKLDAIVKEMPEITVKV